MLTRRQFGQLTFAGIVRWLIRRATGNTEQESAQSARTVAQVGSVQIDQDDHDPRDAIGLPCAGCGQLLNRIDASYERQQRHDLLYPVTGRWLLWTDEGWLCARCAHPPRVRRAVQFVPGIADRWITDVDGWLVEGPRGPQVEPPVELGDGVR